MQSSLLATKLYFPLARPHLVQRPRLLERLQTGLTGALTLVSAPTGFGKTMLLSAWRRGPGAHAATAWLSLDPADNDPTRFLQYLCTSLDGVHPGLAEQTLALLDPSDPPQPEAILSLLLNLLSELPQDTYLILDDYHVIENPAIHQGLTFLLEHLPPQLHLVILTRSDPPLPLARLRARSHLTEIRAEHLRFTTPEALEFLNQVMGLNLSLEQAAALEARTEGWIAGLQLAALSLQGCQDAAGFINAFSGSHSYIVDYLGEEVLNCQPEPLRQFLLRTSVLETLCASLCSALTGDPDAQGTIEKLAHANLFLTPLDNERRWYRYHQLFADLLRSRLRLASPELIPQLHRQAAAWFDGQQLPVQAVEHTFAVQDYSEVRRILRKHYPGWIRPENRGKMMSWFESFPRAFLQKEPWLCVVYAWSLWGQGKIAQTEACLDDAQFALDHPDDGVHLPAGDPEIEYLPAEVLAFRALIASQRNEPEKVIENAKRSFSLTAGRQAPEASVVRGIAGMALVIAHRQKGELDLAVEASRSAVQEAVLGGERGTIVSAFNSLGVTLVIQGRLRQAAEAYQDGIRYGEGRAEAHHPAYSMLYLRLADLHFQWNNLAQAQQYIKEGLQRADFSGCLWPVIYGRSLSCQVKCAAGDRQGAMGVYAEILKLQPGLAGAYFEDEIESCLAYTRARLGFRDEAEAWLDETPPAEIGAERARAAERLLLRAKIELILDRPSQSFADLTRLTDLAERWGAVLWQIEALALQAVSWHKDGEPGRALAALQQALRLGEEENFVRLFLDHGAPMLELLRQAHSRGIACAYCTRLLEAAAQEVIAQPLTRQPLIAPLSKRELELLALISAGRANKEIAAELYISLGTVKRHTVNIFNKLDARNRTEAVAKARQLGLL